MKKKSPISLFPAVCLLLLVVILLYFFLYFQPTRLSMTSMQAETTLFKTEASMYAPHLNDHSQLEAQIADSEDRIANLHKTGYTNDSSVSLVIGEAIQRFNVTLNAINLDDPTTVDEHRALPIYLTLTGTLNDTLSFIEFFENNQDGSYLVHAVSTSINGETCQTNIVMYLCSPAEKE